MEPAHDSAADLAAALPGELAFEERPRDEQLAGLPAPPAVVLLAAADGRPIQLATTQNLRRFAQGRLAPTDEQTRKADLAAITRRVRWRETFSAFENRWWYWRLARQLHPRAYRKLIGFGPAWFLHLPAGADVPEIRVTERIWRDAGSFIGPWPTQRAATAALEGLWDLFDLCRYPEEVRKAPAGRRCAYADMGRCDAPCDGSVPMSIYAQRTAAAWQFAGGAHESWIADANERMRRAAAELAFERAGLLKKQLAFAEKWRREWAPRVRPADDLQMVLLVPATRRKAATPFLFRQGSVVAGALTADRKLPAVLPMWLREQVATPPAETDDLARMEQTWLVSHYLNTRESERGVMQWLDRSPADVAASLLEAWRDKRARPAGAADEPDPHETEPENAPRDEAR